MVKALDHPNSLACHNVIASVTVLLLVLAVCHSCWCQCWFHSIIVCIGIMESFPVSVSFSELVVLYSSIDNTGIVTGGFSQKEYAHYISHMWHIFQRYIQQIYVHISSILWSPIIPIWPGALNTSKLDFMLLAHIPEQIWLPHSKYRSHCTHSEWAYGLNSVAYMCPNITNCNIYSTCCHYICARNKYAHHISHIWHIFHKHIQGMSVHTHTIYETTGINHVTRSSLHISCQ